MVRDHPAHTRYAKAFPAEPSSLRAIRREIGEIARACGLTDGRLHDVRLAVSEVVSNAITHGYGGAGGEVRVRVCEGNGELLVVIADDGAGMAPRVDSPGLGLGLPMVATVCERLELVTPDRGGTEVHMVFPCPAGLQVAAGPA